MVWRVRRILRELLVLLRRPGWSGLRWIVMLVGIRVPILLVVSSNRAGRIVSPRSCSCSFIVCLHPSRFLVCAPPSLDGLSRRSLVGLTHRSLGGLLRRFLGGLSRRFFVSFFLGSGFRLRTLLTILLHFLSHHLQHRFKHFGYECTRLGWIRIVGVVARLQLLFLRGS